MRIVSIIMLLLTSSNWVCAEGTKELRPTASDNGGLHIGIMGNNYNTPFGVYNAPVENQIRVRIASLDEKLYLGMGESTRQAPFRVKAPSGAIVYQANFPGNGNPGHIANWQQAVTGPSQITPGGYNAIEIIPTETGDYVIEFNPSGGDFEMHLFDATVADASGNPVMGRLHSLGWQINTRNYNNPFKGKVYPYDPKGVVYEVDFNGMQPFLFVINFNSTGTANTGDFIKDRQSKIGNYTYPEFEVFLNPPDPDLFPSFERNVTMSGEVTISNCQDIEYCLNFSSNSEGYLDGFIDINGDELFTTGTDIDFSHYFESQEEVCIPWNGKDANGNFVTGGNLKVIASFGFGVTHLPIFDAEHNVNGYIVKIISPENSTQPVIFWDDRFITQGSTLGDPKINLTGCDPIANNGCHKWQNRGDRFGNNTPNRPESPETINTWWYASVLYDTLLISVADDYPVRLSFDPNGLRQSDTTICEGSEVPIYIFDNGSNHYNASKYTYAWFHETTPVGLDSREINKSFFENTYVAVVATDRSNPNCISSDTLRILTVPPVKINAAVNPANCNGVTGSVTVTITDGPPNPQFTWSQFPSNISNSISGLNEGTYSLYIEDPDFPSSCALDTFFMISDVPDIHIKAIEVSPTLCYLNAGTATVEMEDPGRTYVYSWNNQSFVSSASISGLASGNHNVIVREPSTGCTDTAPFTITDLPFSISTEKKDIVCENPTGSITIIAPEASFEVNWNGIKDNVYYKENLNKGIYHIEVVYPPKPSCRAVATAEIVNTSYTVDADFSVIPLSYGQRMETETEFKFTNLSKGNIVNSSWDFGDGNTSLEFSPTHIYNVAADYTIELKVKDENGCPGIARKSIYVQEKVPCGIGFPNAFSPNNDQDNDDIGILGFAEKVDLKIFNRWGEVVFRAEQLTERWDGTYRAEPAPIGVYPFILNWECPDENGILRTYQKVGDVTLVR